MNFLAHFYLSCDSEPLMVGNFLADFIRNHQIATFPEAVREGIILHRKIDTYTDLHPVVRQGTGRLRPKHRKYAPVVLDVFFDYLLAHNWAHYHPKPLGQFTAEVYQVLEKNLEWMPPAVQHRVPLMIADDWLQRYGTKEGLEFTFERLKRRTSFPDQLNGAFESLEADFDTFNAEFNRFFPDVIAYVQEQCRC